MRALELKDIKEHIYHDAVCSTAYCALWGIFPEDETERSGLKTFDFIFAPPPACDDGGSVPRMEDATLLSLDVKKNDYGYEVTYDCEEGSEDDLKFHHIHFTCDSITVVLSRFEEFSYANIYDEELCPEHREYLDEKYFIGSEEFDISDGITVRYDIYGEGPEYGTKYYGAHIAKCIYFKNGEKLFEHLTDKHHLHPFKKVIHHSNGHTYIAYHTDLYGISFFEVETGRRYDYIPEGQEHDYRDLSGESFIVCDIFYDRDSDMLACDGCYWACPNEIFVMDFSDPMNYDPRMVRMHGEIPMDYNEYDDIDFLRWEDDGIVLKGEDKNEYTVTKDRLREMLANKKAKFPLP